MAEQKFYIAKVGLDWLDPMTGQPVRVEVGERCDDIPLKSSDWLLDQGLIVPCTKDGKPIEKGKGKD